MADSPTPLPGDSDDVERAHRLGFRDRDPSEWERALALYGPALRRQAALLLPHSMDRDDAVGEVWLTAVRSARKYDPDRPLYPWLARICAHVCLTRRRGLLRRLATVIAPSLRRVGDDDAAMPPEGTVAIRSALGSLSAREREATTLRFLHEVSVRDVALLMDCNPSAVSMALRRALDRLRREAGAEMRQMAAEFGCEEREEMP